MTDRTNGSKAAVAIVVDPDYGSRLRSLGVKMPVWAVKSSANSVAWIPESSRFSNSALFSVEDVEARTENLIGALADVEDHFGPDSFPQNPYTAIYVIGIDLSAAIRERLASEGFENFRQAENGFEADRSR